VFTAVGTGENPAGTSPNPEGRGQMCAGTCPQPRRKRTNVRRNVPAIPKEGVRAAQADVILLQEKGRLS